ncbi:MAG: site-2 protease family protein [Nitrospinae bacterium]|nr:site-2 protease family protein [Nitrospinota bacterium]
MDFKVGNHSNSGNASEPSSSGSPGLPHGPVFGPAANVAGEEIDAQRALYGSERPSRLRDYLVFGALLTATLTTTFLAGGFLFAVSLILILGSHEFGHYWASRKNRVNASLPYFIPAPPMFIAGTFGAFIRIKDPIPDRRVMMEIGAAGPIAGFIVAIPTLIAGLFMSRVTEGVHLRGLSFGSSIVLSVFSRMILGVDPLSPDVNIELHPVAFAGWIGMFVTALNLLPIGQLDGGHIIYSLFRVRYNILAKVFFVLLFPLGYYWTGWWFWALLIALFGFQHPPLMDESAVLEKRHKIMGYIAVIIFLLTFTPIPFTVVM